VLVQGIVEIIRCVLCIRQGECRCARRTSGVDVGNSRKWLHVTDEDIRELDKFVVQSAAAQMRLRKELYFAFR